MVTKVTGLASKDRTGKGTSLLVPLIRIPLSALAAEGRLTALR